jgi:hypothetical protein
MAVILRASSQMGLDLGEASESEGLEQDRPAPNTLRSMGGDRGL